MGVFGLCYKNLPRSPFPKKKMDLTTHACKCFTHTWQQSDGYQDEFFFLPWKTPPKIAVVVGVMHNQFNRFTGKTVLLLNWSFYTGLLHFSLLPPPDLTPLKKDWITLGSQKTVTRSAIMCKTSIKSGVFGHPLPPSQVAIIFESIFILPSSAAALYVKPGGSV